MPVGQAPQRALTVSEVTALVRAHLEDVFPDVWVQGEISNLRTPSSGHVYCTLKDAACQIRAVVFRSTAQRVRFELREGMEVLVRGRLTVYEPRGEYQLVLEYLEPKGVGALQVLFEQLKEKLAAEGLFDPARKRSLPFLPRRVGVVTSVTGAAIRDMVSIMRRRCPIVEIVLYPVAVQGEAAASEIAQGVRALSDRGDLDVLIVGRGGGSWEDLWCFNEETVVRAIAESRVPVVSAVGHEIDVTLADFVADYRAPTPSAAAEIVVPVLDEIRRALLESALRQERALLGRLSLLRQRVDGLQRQLPLMRVRMLRQAQRLDDLRASLVQTVGRRLYGARERLLRARQALGIQNPLTRVRSETVLVQQTRKRLEQGIVNVVARKRQLVLGAAGLLDSLSPLAILGRGYSIVQHLPSGAIVRDARTVSINDRLRARLAKGRVVCQVTEIEPDA